MRLALGALTVLTSVLTCLVSGWMFTMYFVLQHPGYQRRAVVAALIFAGAAAVIAAVADRWRPAEPGRVVLILWALGLTALGALAFFSRDPHIDMWQVVAGLLFMIEGPLTLIGAIRHRVIRHPPSINVRFPPCSTSASGGSAHRRGCLNIKATARRDSTLPPASRSS